MVGIEVLKKNLLVLAKLTNAVDKALEDGKISLAEGIGLSFKAIDLIGVFKTLKESKEQLADLDMDEVNELTEAFAEEFDIRNDKAEEVVESVLMLALQAGVSMDVFSKMK